MSRMHFSSLTSAVFEDTHHITEGGGYSFGWRDRKQQGGGEEDHGGKDMAVDGQKSASNSGTYLNTISATSSKAPRSSGVAINGMKEQVQRMVDNRGKHNKKWKAAQPSSSASTAPTQSLEPAAMRSLAIKTVGQLEVQLNDKGKVVLIDMLHADRAKPPDDMGRIIPLICKPAQYAAAILCKTSMVACHV
ncbi:hypothetical protein SERLADRAFT_407143 [Serpula lacrymans var. lacrymans S7.9]|uniref:Uncharacterized protein n=1 Tax=Serpula lacrymans var. lacrymans (strain S7.9) TaxID=578457 RepID=F8NRQ5_SERL9|nr:uncharacterized protein SERLADRAFT_407143 [Serpula lacrymans var. lacrymans S7.9]EGO26321.1 hypothetical protein SERLADRAFT_407143 [Serpula lacrymans var. lacrymans S7.9]